ncbi:hypothetical protein CPB97_000350 [Podila verticillata]|nr:hypothetical protein CPB97_000350 [Podila verticillata]
MLAERFGRRITGIHNRTFGPVFDALECIIQRDFGYTTDDVRQLYAVTKRKLLNKDNHKVVLIGHSQGGIIASMVVDRLLDTLGEGPLRKLEVYTFASAANHMHGGGVLPHIEHFANEYDFVARTGVMAYHQSVMPGNKYDGELYIDRVATGHLLNMHYLRTTFMNGNDAMRSYMATTYLGGQGGVPVPPGGGGGGGGGGEGGGGNPPPSPIS